MEEVEESTKPVSEVAKQEESKIEESKGENAPEEEEDKMDIEPEEEFVVVESGGEGDPMAQEMAVPAEQKESDTVMQEDKKEDGVGAGAQPSADNNVVEQTTAPPTAVPGKPYPPASSHFTGRNILMRLDTE